jgi:hypothetical protein
VQERPVLNTIEINPADSSEDIWRPLISAD